jgi:hypothetical protein
MVSFLNVIFAYPSSSREMQIHHRIINRYYPHQSYNYRKYHNDDDDDDNDDDESDCDCAKLTKILIDKSIRTTRVRTVTSQPNEEVISTKTSLVSPAKRSPPTLNLNVSNSLVNTSATNHTIVDIPQPVKVNVTVRGGGIPSSRKVVAPVRTMLVTPTPKQLVAPVRTVVVTPTPKKIVAPVRTVVVTPTPKKVVAPVRTMLVTPTPKKVVAPVRAVVVVPAARKVVAPVRAVVVTPTPKKVVAPVRAVVVVPAARKVVAPVRAVVVVPAARKVVAPVRVPFTFVTATASGDPHTDTFDGIHHDTMVAGWFTWVKNSVINVQAFTQLGCMPASIPNTCLRAVVVQIKVPNTNDSLIVSWGSWPPSGKAGDQNIVIVDSTGKGVNTPPSKYKSDNYLGNRFRVAMSGGNLVISPIGSTITDPNLAVSVSIGPYFLAVTLPKIAPHKGSTNGLMGFFNGDGSKDYSKCFRNKDNTPSKITKKSLCQGGVGACGWASQQKPEILDWAITHVVTNPIDFSNKPKYVQPKVYESFTGRRLLQVEDSFSPIPVISEAIVYPSFTPKVTPEKLSFCNNMLKRVLRNKSKSVYRTQLNSCLQDADSPSVARSIGKAIVTARVQQAKAKRALKVVVVKKQKLIERKKLLLQRKPSYIPKYYDDDEDD